MPTRYAAGVPHKAHEAAARGLPMVVTPLIADQLGWHEQVPVGADARAFADQCLRLHSDAAHWASVRQHLLASVARDCSPATFDRALQAVLGRPAGLQVPPSPPMAEPALPADDMTDGEPSAAEAHDADRTAEVWGRDARSRQHAEHALRHWASHPVTAAEINRAVSGDPQVGWMEHLKRRHFVRSGRRGLSLGCGGGAAVVDAALLDIVDVMEGLDLSPGAVAVAQERAATQGVAHRVRFAVADLNRPALQGPYDLVMFEQSLHHIDALDAVLDECARVLAPGGLFVINEYVGADRFQWSDEAERLMNELLQRLPPGHRIDPDSGAAKLAMQRSTPEQVVAVDPSEAIHSSAILAACEARFELVERKDFGGTLLQFMLAGISANFEPGDERDVALLRLMALLEAELVRAGALASDFVFAVYRRRGG